MKKLFIILFVLSCLISSCTVSVNKVASNQDIHYDEAYDFSDKKAIVKNLVASLLKKEFIDNEKPIVIIYNVANRTAEHIDTNAITDEIRLELLNTGKFRFINDKQRVNIDNEMQYQYDLDNAHGGVLPESQIAKAKQLGVQYILSGTLYSIDKEEPKQVRLKKKVLKYYSLNLELTDIKTGLIAWADKTEIIREASKPFIGW